MGTPKSEARYTTPLSPAIQNTTSRTTMPRAKIRLRRFIETFGGGRRESISVSPSSVHQTSQFTYSDGEVNRRPSCRDTIHGLRRGVLIPPPLTFRDRGESSART